MEKFNPWAGVRVDLFGFIDIVVLDDQFGLLAVQATSTDNAPSRVRKIVVDCKEAAVDWLSSGNRIEVWGWAKRGAQGTRKTWTLKRYILEYREGEFWETWGTENHLEERKPSRRRMSIDSPTTESD